MRPAGAHRAPLTTLGSASKNAVLVIFVFFDVGCKRLQFTGSCLPVLYMLDALGNQPVGLQLFWSGLQYVTERPASNVYLMMMHACGHMGVLHLVRCSIVGSDCVQFSQNGRRVFDHAPLEAANTYIRSSKSTACQMASFSDHALHHIALCC